MSVAQWIGVFVGLGLAAFIWFCFRQGMKVKNPDDTYTPPPPGVPGGFG